MRGINGGERGMKGRETDFSHFYSYNNYVLRIPVILSIIIIINFQLPQTLIIMRLIHILNLFLSLLLITSTTSSCLDSYQVDGHCSSCDSLSFLDAGRCYLKVRGCLQNMAGPICIECQNGYVLDKGLCIREAVYYNLTSLDPAVVKIEGVPSLIYSEIRSRLGEKYGSQFPKVHKYLLERHSELETSRIINVQNLESKKEALIKVQYQAESGHIFEAIVYIDLFNNIKELSFSPDELTHNDPVLIGKDLALKYNDILSNYFLYNFNHTSTLFTYTFMDQAKQVIRISVQKTMPTVGGDDGDDDDSGEDGRTNDDIKILSLFDLAQEEIENAFPEFKGKARTNAVQVSEEIYILEFDNEVSISVEFLNFFFKVNAPVSKTPPLNPTLPEQSQPFSDIIDFSSPEFITASEFCYDEFPELSNAIFTRAEDLHVEDGIKFRFKFELPEKGITFTFIVHWSSNGNKNSLVSAFKNSEQIYFKNFDHNTDLTFLAIYQEIAKQSTIYNLPPISSVTKKIHSEIIEYIVSYSEEETAVLAYDPQNKQATLLSFIIGGEDVLEILNPEFKRAAQFRNEIVLFNFLNQEKPETLGGKIEHISFDLISSYDLYIVTHEGFFLATINDLQGILVLSVFQKLSNSTCYELSQDYISKNEKIQYISTFLQQNYPIKGYQIQLVQANVQELSTEYRFLYSTNTLKQIQIRLVEQDVQAKVIKASVLNFGYQILNPEPTNKDYATALQILSGSNLKGDHIPFYSEVNSTHLRIYYDDGSATTEIVVDKNSKGGKGVVIGVRKLKLVPDEVSLGNLIKVDEASEIEKAKIGEIMSAAAEKYAKYFVSPLLKFVEKKVIENEEKYLIFVKTELGYVKFRATVLEKEAGNSILLEQLVITEDKDEDFSSCKKWNMEGRCLSCTDQEVEYQGSCHPKLLGCLIQPGDICVRCNSNYIRSGYQCFRNCSNFFN